MFTIGERRRYIAEMLLVALIAASATTQPAPPVRAGALVQATATIRIVSGQRLRLGSATPTTQLRATRLVEADGSASPARLIEFP